VQRISALSSSVLALREKRIMEHVEITSDDLKQLSDALTIASTELLGASLL